MTRLDRHRAGTAVVADPRCLRLRGRPAYRTCAAGQAAADTGAGDDHGKQSVEVAGPADGHPVGIPDVEARPARVEDPAGRADAHRRAQAGQRVDRSLRSLADRLALVDRQALEQPPGRLGLDDVVDQRRLARTRYARDDGEPALGEVHVDTLQVVGAGAAYADGIARSSVGARLGARPHPRLLLGNGRTAVLQAAAVGTTARAQIDAPVGGGD